MQVIDFKKLCACVPVSTRSESDKSLKMPSINFRGCNFSKFPGSPRPPSVGMLHMPVCFVASYTISEYTSWL